MQTNMGFQLGLGGCALGLIRGLIEVIRLKNQYPLCPDFFLFGLETALLYGLVIGVGGLLPAIIVGALFKRKQSITS
ncbi:hypothetical protein JXA80_13730, partial [bacterium]|nr:hypothetical protein [candidate division CSSED10-310 bacterium]